MTPKDLRETQLKTQDALDYWTEKYEEAKRHVQANDYLIQQLTRENCRLKDQLQELIFENKTHHEGGSQRCLTPNGEVI